MRSFGVWKNNVMQNFGTPNRANNLVRYDHHSVITEIHTTIEHTEIIEGQTFLVTEILENVKVKRAICISQ